MKKLFRNWHSSDTAVLLIMLCMLGLVLTTYYFYSNKPQQVITPNACSCQLHKPACPNNIVDPCEYQFFVEDSMFAVYNNDRFVGMAPVDGSMGKLIIQDNE